MLTPTFKLSQNDQYLFVNIKAPYAKLSEAEVYVDDNDFRFYCKPYYLRLNLPGKIVENNESGTYDVDEGVFKFKFEKANNGENFEGLDLLTKLLTPITKSKETRTNPLIEECNDVDGKEEEKTTNHETGNNPEDEFDDEEDDDQWFIEQTCNQTDDDTDVRLTSNSVKYGFAQTKSNIFSKLSSEYGLVIDLKEPDSTKVADRKQLRIDNENEKFEQDHYLADLFDNEYIDTVLLKYKTDFRSNDDDDDDDDDDEYTQKEIDCLKSLPRKTHLLDKEQKFYAYMGLVDILFAYCYNNRVNCGERNVETGWTIAKLSSTLSWFDVFNSLEEVLIASYRRSLCFPLFRNWKLTKKVHKDLIKLLNKGRKFILKKLIEIRQNFIDEDCRYILNDLYINDYCIWIQYIKDKKIASLVESLEKIKISKEDVDLDLECIELAGKLAIEEGDQSEHDEEPSSKETTKETGQTTEIQSQNENTNHQEDDSTSNDNQNSLVLNLENLKLEENLKTDVKPKPLIEELN